jgi:hypothetical protein
MKYQIALKLILVIILCFSLFLKAQDFDAQVTINTDALSPDAKDKVSTFKQQVEDYFNRNKFYENSYFNETNMPGSDVYKIKLIIQFNFTSGNSDNYNVQMFVTTQRIIDKYDKKKDPKYTTAFRNLDERCAFTYTKSMQFIKNDLRFDPLLSLLDYYAYMALGYDQDSFFPKDDPKNKSAYFQKAFDICNKQMSDKNGWTETGGGSKPSRLQLVQELLNPRFDDFRNGFFEYHWFGLDSLGLSKNSHRIILNAIRKISGIKKKEVKAFNVDLFFEAKNAEIAELFLNYGDKTVYDQLMQYDPSHQRIYEDAKKRAK